MYLSSLTQLHSAPECVYSRCAIQIDKFSSIKILPTLSCRLGQNELTVQQYQEDPLLLFGMPFTVTAYVLVTSLSPLRAYLHSDGVIQFRHDYQRNFQKVRNETVYMCLNM